MHSQYPVPHHNLQLVQPCSHPVGLLFNQVLNHLRNRLNNRVRVQLGNLLVGQVLSPLPCLQHSHLVDHRHNPVSCPHHNHLVTLQLSLQLDLLRSPLCVPQRSQRLSQVNTLLRNPLLFLLRNRASIPLVSPAASLRPSPRRSQVIVLARNRLAFQRVNQVPCPVRSHR